MVRVRIGPRGGDWRAELAQAGVELAAGTGPRKIDGIGLGNEALGGL